MHEHGDKNGEVISETLMLDVDGCCNGEANYEKSRTASVEIEDGV